MNKISPLVGNSPFLLTEQDVEAVQQQLETTVSGYLEAQKTGETVPFADSLY